MPNAAITLDVSYAFKLNIADLPACNVLGVLPMNVQNAGNDNELDAAAVFLNNTETLPMLFAGGILLLSLIHI